MVGQTARRRIQKPLHRLSAGEGLLSNTTSIEHGALWHIDITKLPPSSHPELRVWSNAQVHEQLAQIVPQVPSHFDKLYKNPCWHMAEDARLSCLPYTYLLGMPKCGTSDLYERIIRHPEVHPPERKEIRWFTRGEFAEANDRLKRLGDDTLQGFLRFFRRATEEIEENHNAITIDGGPHTLWWPIQLPNGIIPDDEVPIPSILHAIQPNAKFIITLQDPVARTFSDYYFLADDKKPIYRREGKIKKSAKEFHERMTQQVAQMTKCIADLSPDNGWFRASQICAHDRFTFGRAGWGRICIGMYVAYLAKWIPLFDSSNFLILKMEDYDSNPKEYMRSIYKFLDLREPTEDQWKDILFEFRANVNPIKKEAMLPETEQLLRNFFMPYNRLLAHTLKDERFIWPQTSPHVHHVQNIHGPEGLLQRPLPLLEHGKEHVNSKDPSASKHLRGVNPKFVLQVDEASLPGRIRPPEEWHKFARETIPVPFKEDTPPSTAFSLEIGAIREALHEFGAYVNYNTEDKRNPLHCAAAVFMLGDSFPGSYVFNLLKGTEGWLSEVLHPPLQKQLNSVSNAVLLESLQEPIRDAAEWFVAARADVNRADGEGFTPLIMCGIGGLTRLAELLLSHGAHPNAKDSKGRTALHWAGVLGNAETASVILKYGGSGTVKNNDGFSFYDVAKAPGPIHPELAKKWLQIDQSPPKLLPLPARDLQNGGWGTEVLEGYENVLLRSECDLDMFNADEISADKLYREYIAMNRPVLIRGLIDRWPARQVYAVDEMQELWGDMLVHVSSIPYEAKFDGNTSMMGTDMRLYEYIDEMVTHTILGNRYPWYVFKPFPLPAAAEKSDSPVRHDLVPTPKVLLQALKQAADAGHVPNKAPPTTDLRSKLFVNAQWAIGGEGTGAPVHFHNTAINALVYGIKKWFMFPPSSRIMSNSQIRAFVELELPLLNDASTSPLTCVQHAGDVMIVPESWGHGVLNLQESVCVATEVRGNLFRISKLPKPFIKHDAMRRKSEDHPRGPRQAHEEHKARNADGVPPFRAALQRPMPPHDKNQRAGIKQQAEKDDDGEDEPDNEII